MPVFFISSSAIQSSSITLDGPLFDHLYKSLRIREGHEIVIGDEQRRRYHTRVTKVGKNSLDCDILQTQHGPPVPPFQLILGQAILKGDHMSWAIQKATELGVSAITPLVSDRVMVRPKASRFTVLQERWQRIAVDAAQQSERWDIPEIHPPSSFSIFMETTGNEGVGCILVERQGTKRLRSLPINEHFTGKIIVTVGPEGGWTNEERRQAIQYDFSEVTIGATIFRAETAPLVALTLIQNQLGEFG